MKYKAMEMGSDTGTFISPQHKSFKSKQRTNAWVTIYK